MTAATAIAIGLAAVSTTATSVAYLREHDAAAQLPPLAIRRPLRSARLLGSDRSWLIAFALETIGFMLYAAALGLASLALVQSIAAGGIGVLAYVTARVTGRTLGRRELAGVTLSILGLLALGVSLAAGAEEGGQGELAWILVWLGASGGVALLVLALRGRSPSPARAVASGIAGGLLFSIGDISTKIATEGGPRIAFMISLVLGYLLGTLLLQVGYQSGEALTVAGIATLLTNALPIAAGTVVLDEPVPGGAYGGLRVLAFAAVTAGGFFLARPRTPAL
jgi:hypothetical protein